jgi:hypothetical protein
MIHDAHCHFFSARFFEALARDKAILDPESSGNSIPAVLGWESPGEPVDLADRWVLEMDQHHVTRVALISSVPGDEESVAVAVERHPRRFVGWCMLDPTQEDAEERTERALNSLGLRCICLFPAMHRYQLDDVRVRKIFDVAADHSGVAVFVHCGVLSVGVRKKLGLASKFDIRFGDPLSLYPIATAHPNLPIILPHFGAGFFREALMTADLCPNVYLDTSSSNSWMKYFPGLTLVDVFRKVLEIVGVERLLFGTDSSFFPRGWQRSVWETQQEAVRQAGADAAEMDQIFNGNFQRLFGQ